MAHIDLHWFYQMADSDFQQCVMTLDLRHGRSARANFYFSLFYQRDMLHWDLMFIFLLFVVSAWPICLLFQSVVHFFYGESTAFDSLNNRTELYVSEGERERERESQCLRGCDWTSSARKRHEWIQIDRAMRLEDLMLVVAVGCHSGTQNKVSSKKARLTRIHSGNWVSKWGRERECGRRRAKWTEMRELCTYPQIGPIN